MDLPDALLRLGDLVERLRGAGVPTRVVLVSGSTMQVKGCIVGILCKSNNFLRMQ